MTTISPGILALMTRPKIAWNWNIQPEQRLSIECADYLRELTLTGKLNAVWCHVPNEGKRHNIVGAILKAMGMLPGSPDFWFIWRDGGGVIELKCGKNWLTDYQQYFMTWAVNNGVRQGVAKSLDEFKAILDEWGVV